MSIPRELWQAAYDEVRRAPLPNDDAVTTTEFAALFGIARVTADRRLRDLVAHGRAVEVHKVIRRRNGAVYPATAYRLVEGPCHSHGSRGTSETGRRSTGSTPPTGSGRRRTGTTGTRRG